MFAELQDTLAELMAGYGIWLVAGVIAVESLGVPLPGEATLITGCIYAGTTHRIDVSLVLLAGIAGAIVGDNIGYCIGRKAGFPLLVRHGGRVGLDGPTLKLGRYLFLRHGGKVVFFGRFVAVLRAWAALLAGANRMDWRWFLLCNVAGAVVWVGGYGLGAYFLGAQIRHLLGPVGLAGLVVAAVAGGWLAVKLKRHRALLQAEAELAFPGPVTWAKNAPHPERLS